MSIVLFIIIVLFEFYLVIMGNKPYKIEEELIMNKTALQLAYDLINLWIWRTLCGWTSNKSYNNYRMGDN